MAQRNKSNKDDFKVHLQDPEELARELASACTEALFSRNFGKRGSVVSRVKVLQDGVSVLAGKLSTYMDTGYKKIQETDQG